MSEFICNCVVCKEHRKKDKENAIKTINLRKAYFQRIRNSPYYKEWRIAVLKRDNYTCQKCNTKENIEAHHIKPIVVFPELSYIVDNGETLCVKCHDKSHPALSENTYLKVFGNLD